MSTPHSGGDPEYVRAPEAAKRIGVSLKTVHRLIKDGALPGSFSFKLGARHYWQVPVSAIARLKSEGNPTPSVP